MHRRLVGGGTAIYEGGMRPCEASVLTSLCLLETTVSPVGMQEKYPSGQFAGRLHAGRPVRSSLCLCAATTAQGIWAAAAVLKRKEQKEDREKLCAEVQSKKGIF